MDYGSAFQPLAFKGMGVKTEANSDDDLRYFADCMQEDRLPQIWAVLGEHLSEREFSDLKVITEKVKNLIGIAPQCALLSSFLPYRLIRLMVPKKVVEVGPGSGYLGALLLHNGFDYQCTDVTPGFVAWQERLFAGFTDKIVHVAWSDWHFDAETVVVANHVLNEMHPHALMYLAERASAARCLLIESFGADYYRQAQESEQVLLRYGVNTAIVGPQWLYVGAGVRAPAIDEFWHRVGAKERLAGYEEKLGRPPLTQIEINNFCPPGKRYGV